MPEVRLNPRKWAQRASQAGGDYADGVNNPRRSQSESAIAAVDNYEAGIQNAIAQNSYTKGLQRAGDEKWRRGVQEKGRQRYQTGVNVAESEYQKGFAPYAQAIQSTTLPPRGPKGQNYGRVQAIGEALRKAKQSL